MVKRNIRRVKTTVFTFALLAFIFNSPAPLYAPWIWTPENGWMNEKDVVKESPKAQWEYAQNFKNKGEYNNAVHAYQALVKAYPTSPLAPQAEMAAAKCYQEEGMYYEAFQRYQKLLENYPRDINLEEILKEEYEIGTAFIRGKRRTLLHLPILPAVDKGIEILQTVVKNAPYSEISPQAQFDLGTIYKKQGKYTEAIEAYTKFTEDYKGHKLYEEALYQIGWCNYKKSRGFSYDQLAAKEAEKYFKKFGDEFPKSEHSEKINSLVNELSNRQAKGTLEIASYYASNNHKEAAIMYYKEVIKMAPESIEAKEAEKQLKKLEQ